MTPTVVRAQGDIEDVTTTFHEVIAVLYRPIHMILVAISWITGLIFASLSLWNFGKSLQEQNAQKANENKVTALKCLIGVGVAVAAIPTLRAILNLFGVDIASIVNEFGSDENGKEIIYNLICVIGMSISCFNLC